MVKKICKRHLSQLLRQEFQAKKQTQNQSFTFRIGTKHPFAYRMIGIY